MDIQGTLQCTASSLKIAEVPLPVGIWSGPPSWTLTSQPQSSSIQSNVIRREQVILSGSVQPVMRSSTTHRQTDRDQAFEAFEAYDKALRSLGTGKHIRSLRAQCTHA